MAFCDNKYCTKCKLHLATKINPVNGETVKVLNPGIMGRGDKESKVLILGDFPTKGDDEQGNVFLGKKSSQIVKHLDAVGLNYFLATAIKCRVLDDKKKTTPTQRACCKPFTIKIIEDMKPKVIVTLGQVPIQQLLGMSYSIKVLRGRSFYFPELNAYIVPTYSYKLLQMEHDVLLNTQFKKDLELARSILENPPKRRVLPFLRSLTESKDIEEYLQSLFLAKDVVIDVETTGLDPRKDTITDISFSSKPNEGVHIKWEAVLEFENLFRKFLETDILKCFHNAAFDREMLFMEGFRKINNIGYDTMLAFHTIAMSFEGKEQDGLYKLKTMAWFTSEHGGYDAVLDEEGGITGIQGIKPKKEEKPKKLPYFWIDEISKTFGEFKTKKELNDHLKVNKESKVVTQEEYLPFKEAHTPPPVFNRLLLKKEPEIDWDYYNDLIDNRRKERMEKTGLDKLPYYSAMDALVTRHAMNYTRPEIELTYNKLFYNHIMPLNYVLSRMRINGICLDREAMLRIKSENVITAENIKQEFFSKIKKEINLNSSAQIQNLLFNDMKIKPHPDYVSPLTKKPSADEEALKYYSKKHPELQLILDYRGVLKQTSTYIDGFFPHISPITGRVHASYLQNSTATGRLSCIAKGMKVSCVGEDKNIEDVKVGDLVYCYDDKNKRQISKVKNVFDNGIQRCIKLFLKDGLGYDYSLICTPDHKIKTAQSWVAAEGITNYDSIYFFDGMFALKRISREDVGEFQVFDLEIEDHHNFIVNEICAHNCSSPNMQNIPKDNRIRNIVVPSPGWKLVSADLSQAELRVLAQMSRDEEMLAAFASGKDLHAITACKALLNIDIEQFDRSIPAHNKARDISKTINFGIVYGMSAFTLAVRLGMPMDTAGEREQSVAEAQGYIDKWFGLYSGAKEWLENIVTYCRRVGYVESLFGRRRYLPEIWSSNKISSSGAERQSKNSPIQSTASDITCTGLIRMQNFLDENPHLRSMIVGVIHDDILVDTPDDEIEIISPKLVECMTQDIPGIYIQLVADPSIHEKWTKE